MHNDKSSTAVVEVASIVFNPVELAEEVEVVKVWYMHIGRETETVRDNFLF